MRGRFFLSTLLFAGILLPLTSCSTDPSLTSIVISPDTVTVTLAPNGIAQGYSQFTAIGYYTHPGHAAGTRDITSEVTWASSGTQVATIVTGGAKAGLATATGWVNGVAWTGVTNITASAPGFNGVVVSNAATFTVTDPTTGTDDVVSIAVTPNPYTFTAANAANSFTATGTTQSGVKEVLTTSSVWTSGNASFVTVGANTGVGTAVATGTTTITAKYTNADGTSAQGSATVTVP
jgi:hypothetical protein